MKTEGLLLAVAVVIALTDCSRRRPSDAELRDQTNASTAEVKTEIREAAEATRSYAAGNTDQFVTAMNRKLAEYDQKIGDLGRKIETLNDEAKAEESKALDSLREQREQLGQRLHNARKSGKEIGQEVKAGFESALAELEKSYENIKSKFKG